MSRSTSCSGTSRPNSVMSSPNGIVLNARKAGNIARTGAMQVDRLVRVRREDAFLEEELDPVGEGDRGCRAGRRASVPCASASRRSPCARTRCRAAREIRSPKNTITTRSASSSQSSQSIYPVPPRGPASATASASVGASTGWIVAAIDEVALEERVGRETRLVEGDEDRALRDVLGDAGGEGRLAGGRRRARTSAPSATSARAASAGWISANGGSASAAFSSSARSESRPSSTSSGYVKRRSLAVPDAGGHRGGLCAQRRPRLPRRQEPAHLLVELVEGLEPEVASARERQAREDLPVGPGHPSGSRTARRRCPRPSQVVTWPSFSRKAAAGRNASANGSSEPSSSDCTIFPARSPGRGERAPRPGSRGADRRRQEQHVDLSVGAGLEDAAPVAARLAGSTRSPRRLSTRAGFTQPMRPPGRSDGWMPARSAPRSFARRVT